MRSCGFGSSEREVTDRLNLLNIIDLKLAALARLRRQCASGIGLKLELRVII